MLAPFLLLGAFLYASVGHGGATIYLAILVLGGLGLAEIKQPVLVLNILVASIGFFMFRHAGHLRPRLLLPFVVASVPAAFLGAHVSLATRTESLLLGTALLAGSIRLLLSGRPPRPRFLLKGIRFHAVALILGALLGFLAGATGIGGGIFLSPVLLLMGWATVKETGAVASAFIVLNSLSGLTSSILRSGWPEPGFTATLAGIVVVGGGLGAFLGSHRIPPGWLQRMLGGVLLVAAGRAGLSSGLF